MRAQLFGVCSRFFVGDEAHVQKKVVENRTSTLGRKVRDDRGVDDPHRGFKFGEA